jgi:hypothetical protein
MGVIGTLLRAAGAGGGVRSMMRLEASGSGELTNRDVVNAMATGVGAIVAQQSLIGNIIGASNEIALDQLRTSIHFGGCILEGLDDVNSALREGLWEVHTGLDALQEAAAESLRFQIEAARAQQDGLRLQGEANDLLRRQLLTQEVNAALLAQGNELKEESIRVEREILDMAKAVVEGQRDVLDRIRSPRRVKTEELLLVARENFQRLLAMEEGEIGQAALVAETAALYDEALKLSRCTPLEIILAGWFQEECVGNLERARELYELAYAKTRKEAEAKSAAHALRNLAEVEAKSGRPLKGAEIARKAIAIDPDDLTLRVDLIRHLARAETRAVRAELMEVLAQHPQLFGDLATTPSIVASDDCNWILDLHAAELRRQRARQAKIDARKAQAVLRPEAEDAEEAAEEPAESDGQQPEPILYREDDGTEDAEEEDTEAGAPMRGPWGPRPANAEYDDEE